jgi:hypothetical protein
VQGTLATVSGLPLRLAWFSPQGVGGQLTEALLSTRHRQQTSPPIPAPRPPTSRTGPAARLPTLSRTGRT